MNPNAMGIPLCVETFLTSLVVVGSAHLLPHPRPEPGRLFTEPPIDGSASISRPPPPLVHRGRYDDRHTLAWVCVVLLCTNY